MTFTPELACFNPYQIGQTVTVVFGTRQPMKIVAKALEACCVAMPGRVPMRKWYSVADLNAWGNKPEGRVYKPAPAPIMLPAISSAPPARGDLIRERETGKLFIVANANPAIVWELMPGRGVVDAAFTELFLMQNKYQEWYEIVQRAVWTPNAKQERDINRRVHDDLCKPPLAWKTYTYMDVNNQSRTVRRLEDIA